jgi:hypothetical protein
VTCGAYAGDASANYADIDVGREGGGREEGAAKGGFGGGRLGGDCASGDDGADGGRAKFAQQPDGEVR